MRNKTYMVLLVDRKKAVMFQITNGAVERYKEIVGSYVPKKVKHGENTWDAQDKIFRNFEEHLQRHLTKIGRKALLYSQKEYIAGIIIGGHKQLFTKIIKSLPYPLNKKVIGRFVTELKSPFNEILTRAQKTIASIDRVEKVPQKSAIYGIN